MAHSTFFNGSSGSGKTILLQFKALDCARKGGKVVIVVPLSSTARNSFSSELVDVLAPTEFFHGNHPEAMSRQSFTSSPMSYKHINTKFQIT